MPRDYTPQFASMILRIREDLLQAVPKGPAAAWWWVWESVDLVNWILVWKETLTYCFLQWQSQVDMATPLTELFAGLSYDDLWDDASLKDCISYARGSRLLEIPAEWRPYLPNSL